MAEFVTPYHGPTVTVFGPNLSTTAQRKGDMHVHRSDCGDCAQYGPGRKYGGDDHGWTVLAQSRKDVVLKVYPPGDFGYDADTEWEQYDDLYVAPCVDWR